MKSQMFDKATSLVLMLSALVIAVVLVHREFFPANVATASAVPQSEYVSNWQDALAVGHVLGDSTARVKLVEFADIQCPFCRGYNETIHRVLTTYPKDVAVVFVHYPLSFHPYALAAAKAAECAGRQARFGEMVDALYADQNQLGKKAWDSYAQAAGVGDSRQFNACVADTVISPSIEKGIGLAKAIQASGTPTVVLNGWKYGTPPADTELVRAIKAILDGRKPYSDYPASALVRNY